MPRHIPAFICSTILALLAFSGRTEAQTFGDALIGGTPLIDLRARDEIVTDASKTRQANAQTLRARLGYETADWNGLQLTFEFDEIIAPFSTPYNSTRDGKTAYPLIADPAMTALNRLQISYASNFDTKLVLGRQRLLIGNQRFIGNSGWRQHEQTFDSISVVNTSIPDLSLTYAYLYRINRVYGPDAPNPAAMAPIGQSSYFKSDSHVFDSVYGGVPRLKLEGYAFLLDLAAPGYATPAQAIAGTRLSTATYGGRGDYTVVFDDASAKLSAEYAYQTNYRNNPLSFGLNYFLGEGSLTWHGITGLVGYENLGGNGAIGFATPLATLHAFDGWADMFLTTPANGLDDLYFKAGYLFPAGFIRSKSLNLNIIHHDFKTDRLNRGVGSEWDAQAELPIDSKLSFLAKYANYAGSGAAAGGFPDKSIFWLQTSWKY